MDSEAEIFLRLQTETGWGRVLQRFVEWVKFEPGSVVLDVGTGPGLVPGLLEAKGCYAIGVDIVLDMLRHKQFTQRVVVADSFHLPFRHQTFDYTCASNLLFMLENPIDALNEMGRVTKTGGKLALLNPSERMSIAAIKSFLQRRGLDEFAGQTLLDWARRAEEHHRWSEKAMKELLAQVEFDVEKSSLLVGDGFARLTLATKL